MGVPLLARRSVADPSYHRVWRSSILTSEGHTVRDGTSAMRAEEAYEKLVRRMREQTLLSSCAELLGWDELTYMPLGGVGHRAEQQALLAGLYHEKATDPHLGELLAALEGSELVADPESPAAVNVREMRYAHDRLTRLPRDLVEEEARLTAIAQQAWSVARANDDFAHF